MKELAGIILCFGIFGACKTSSSFREAETQTSHGAGVETFAEHKDAAAHKDTEAHDAVKSGPAEETDRWYAPDGGVARERVRKWGGSTSESWLKEKAGSEEHVDVDAGVSTVRASSSTKTGAGESDSGPALSCISLGWVWTLAFLGAAFFAWRILRRAA